MGKKKILIFIDWFLPGYKAGGPIVSVKNMIDRLADEYEFMVITSDRDFGEEKPYEVIEINEWVKTDKYKILYLSKDKQNKTFLKKLIKDLEFDIVYFNSLFSPKFTLLPLKLVTKTKKGVRIILAPRGMLGAGALQIKKVKKKLFLTYAKLMRIYRGILWQATDDVEIKDIKKNIGKNADIILVNNIPDKLKEYKHREKNKITKFIFLSRISEKKNLEFAIQAFQNIYDENVTFDIYGTYEDQEYLNKCRRESGKLPSNVKVEFKGGINHNNIHIVLSEYHFFILPTKHENFGHSIYEALAAGCPVLISDQTPWRGLESKKAGWDFQLHYKKLWQEKIKELISMSDEEFQKWSRGARKLAEGYVNSPELLEGYRRMLSVSEVP